MNKKGDINWFVVSIIIAILTLVVFVFIIIKFPYEETIDRTACAASITLRAAIPSEIQGVSLPAKEALSIRCKTRNVCITTKSGKGNCTNLGKDFDTMRITATEKGDMETQIKMFLSQEMEACWNMFGEGKLQIFAREATASTFTVKGIICDKIEFDNTVTEGKDAITEIHGLVSYMANYKAVNRNVSYLDYLRGTSEGQTAKGLYGSVINGETAADSISKVDVFSIKNVKTIVYMESTLSTLSQRILGGVGAIVGIWGGSKLGLNWMAAGGAGGAVLGSNFGDTIFKWWNKDLLCPKVAAGVKESEDCGNHVGGLILTEYSKEGLDKYNIDSFENL